MVSATLIFENKVFVKHDRLEKDAVVELKVWELPTSHKYPQGLKYSLFCVEIESKRIIVGIDNHHPKSHHIHFGEIEEHYFFESVEKLIDDFYSFVSARGYSI